MSLISAPVSYGELIDKITILEIKAERIGDPAKQANIRRELGALDRVREGALAATPELAALRDELAAVNRRLWEVEDALRGCEREGRFDAHFVELARSVYRENDRRATLKRALNKLTGSDIVEEKSYLD